MAHGWDPIPVNVLHDAFQRSWKCLEGHTWQRSVRYQVKAHERGEDCPDCSDTAPARRPRVITGRREYSRIPQIDQLHPTSELSAALQSCAQNVLDLPGPILKAATPYEVTPIDEVSRQLVTRDTDPDRKASLNLPLTPVLDRDIEHLIDRFLDQGEMLLKTRLASVAINQMPPWEALRKEIINRHQTVEYDKIMAVQITHTQRIELHKIRRSMSENDPELTMSIIAATATARLVRRLHAHLDRLTA